MGDSTGSVDPSVQLPRGTAEEPPLQRLQQLALLEPLDRLRPALIAADIQIGLQRLVGSLPRIAHFESLEHIVVRVHRAVGALLQIDRAADSPHRPGPALDPDRDPVVGAVVADALPPPLGKPCRAAPIALHRGSFLEYPLAKQESPAEASRSPMIRGWPPRRRASSGHGRWSTTTCAGRCLSGSAAGAIRASWRRRPGSRACSCRSLRAAWGCRTRTACGWSSSWDVGTPPSPSRCRCTTPWRRPCMAPDRRS